MGVVYEVYDRERAELVAAKTLLHFDATSLYLFKQEFRTLVDVRHPNLVRLYEFVQRAGGDVFFTMERVHGVDFLRYVRERPDDSSRLRRALRQLVDGVAAVHQAGKLHRDIKPSNVLVTDEGRVVLLDFGVAIQLTKRSTSAPTPSGEVVGSAVYMAPEQGEGTAPAPASDWYSVGVMLYEALAGRPPFSGALIDVLTMKCMRDPEPPSKLAPGVPADLDAFCMALLDRDAERRPDGAEILRRLGKIASAPPPGLGGSAAQEFVGRAPQLETLRRAFEASRKGELVALRVRGEPGMGKSSLVQRFLGEVERDAGAVVLRGRAYEREAVPYKAVDGAVDALSDLLVAHDENAVAMELPNDLGTLAHLFPVLRRVPSVADEMSNPVSDPRALRGRAFAALRELLARLAARSPLVVFLDDVHWGDFDSATLLLDVLRLPGAPHLLLVMTQRDAEAKESPFCRALLDRWPTAAGVHDIEIGPLSRDDSEALALARLGAEDPLSLRIARAVARESRGSPFLIEELARSNRAVKSASGAMLGVLSLEKMVSERLEKLPEDARVVLETIAVAGHPVRTSVIAAACDRGDVDQTVALLIARRFARTALRNRCEAVEMIHDRIRETVVGLLDAEALRATHGRLARVLAETHGLDAVVDAEEIAQHARGAGDAALEATFTERAAEQAVGALAFDRASRLFRRTIELLSPSSPDVARCRERLAEALKYAGRFEDSAREYLAAAEKAAPERRIELRREAAHQLLSGGHIAKAGEVLHDVLAAVDMKAPRSTLAAVFWLAIYRVRLRALGLRVKEVPENEVPVVTRLRVDALYTVVGGFSMVDPIVGACMQELHLIEALRGADANRVHRALVLEAAHSMSAGSPETARERELLALAARLRERLDTDEPRRYASHIHGLTCFHRGRWAAAAALLRREIDTLPYGHPGMGIVRLYSLFTDYYLGDIGVSIARSRALLALADDRGDLYISVNLRSTAIAAGFLVDDDPEGARASVRTALAQWPQTAFSVQHWHAMLYDAYIDLYTGNGGDAYDRFDRDWGLVKKSLLLHGASVRVPALYLRAALAIASIARRPELASQRVAEARRYAALLEKETLTWAALLATLATAAADNAAGDRKGAIANLRLALERAEATQTRVYTAPARHRLGLLLGGDEGRRTAAGATAELTAQGIRNPERWAAIHLPGTWSAA